MVITKKPEQGPKSPKDRLIELEDMLQTGEVDYIQKYFTRYLRKFLDEKLPLGAKRERYLMLRDLLRDVALIIDLQYDDIKEYVAYAQLRTEALELLKKEMQKEQLTTLAICNSKPTMDASLSLLDMMHEARKNKSLKIDGDELKTPMEETLPI